MVPVTKDSIIAGTIVKYMAIRHVQAPDVARAARMSDRTFRKKRKNPEEFSIRELRDVFDRLKVPKEERDGLL